MERWGQVLRLMIVISILSVAGVVPAHAERQDNPVAVFAALDKVTARISRLEVPIGDTGQFGALKITPRACYTREPTEPPKTTSFVEVDEILLDDSERRIFTGWMFAQSPGLNAVQHPVFDVWLTDCADALSPVVSDEPRTTTTATLDTESGMPLPVRKPSAFAPETTVRRRRSIR